MFTAASLTITKTQKESKCPSKGERLNSIHPYDGIILGYCDTHNMNIFQRHYTEEKKLASKDYKLYDSIYVTSGKSKIIGTKDRT